MLTPIQVENLKSQVQVQVLYLNWRGEEAIRRITPIHVWEGTNPYHVGYQTFLRVYDWERQAERDYAIKDIRWWSNIREEVVVDLNLLYPVESLVEWVNAMNKEINKTESVQKNQGNP